MTTRRAVAVLLTVSALAVGLSLHGQPPVSAQAPPLLRVAHMAPGAPPADIWIGQERIFPALAFKAATDYAALPVGQVHVRVMPSGQTQPVAFDAILDLQSGRQQT